MMCARAAVGLALVVALGAGPARAQGKHAATADALFREARAAMKSGNYKSACPKLAESHRLDPAAGTAINLADCQEKLGKLADALQAARDAVDLLKAGDHRIGPVKDQIAALEKRVPKLTVKLAPGTPEGTRVKRDDVELGEGSLNVALPVNPGEHWIVVVAPGRADSRTKVSLTEGASRTVVVEAGERRGAEAAAEPVASHDTVEPPRRTGPTSTTDSGSTQKTLGWVVVGGGAAFLVAAAYFRYQAGQNADEADKLCPTSPCAKADQYDALRDDEKSNMSLANVSVGIGLLAVAGGTTLVLLAPASPTPPTARGGSKPSSAWGFQLRGVW